MNLERAYTTRAAGKHDAHAIAELFRQEYKESSHPCKSTTTVEATFESRDYAWSVCDHKGAVVAALCMQRKWNHVYEIGYAITHSDHRGHKLGPTMMHGGIQDVQQREDCDLIVAHVRTATALSILTSGYPNPAITVGHDGAINIANGRREYHLITVARNRLRDPLRVIPYEPLLPELDLVARAVCPSLDFRTERGPYAATLLCGPPAQEHITINGCRIGFSRDPSPLSGAVHLSSVEGDDDRARMGALFSFIAEQQEVPYFGLHVLADKTSLIEGLRRIGFNISAFLPGWYPEHGHRYDCVMLSRNNFSTPPVSHGFGAVVDTFRAAFERRTIGRDYAEPLAE